METKFKHNIEVTVTTSPRGERVIKQIDLITGDHVNAICHDLIQLEAVLLLLAKEKL